MSLPIFNADINIHQNIPNEPTPANGYTATRLKELFDQAPNDIKLYINNTLIPKIEAQFATNQALSQLVAGQVNIVDPSNGSKYAWKIENGQVFLEEV